MQCAIIKNKAQIPENVQNYPQYQEQNLSQNYPQFDENATANYDSLRVNISQSADFNATQNQEQAQVSGVYQRGKYLFTKDANGNELIQDPKTGQWHIYN